MYKGECDFVSALLFAHSFCSDFKTSISSSLNNMAYDPVLIMPQGY